MEKSLKLPVNTLKNRIYIFKAILINRPKIFVCIKDQSPTKMTTVLLSGNEATKSQAQSFCNEETEAQTTGAAQQKGQPGAHHCAEFISNRENTGAATQESAKQHWNKIKSDPLHDTID